MVHTSLKGNLVAHFKKSAEQNPKKCAVISPENNFSGIATKKDMENYPVLRDIKIFSSDGFEPSIDQMEIRANEIEKSFALLTLLWKRALISSSLLEFSKSFQDLVVVGLIFGNVILYKIYSKLRFESILSNLYLIGSI